ncbi:hypothetical protein [Pseudactinotalea sp. HY158]|uniref:hypothetical protein n=1 Tax=Pseudactinotalea sp. HY158 TaxID=2654547 RepID=UPI00129CB1B1|nr:hypothetical protein [Pseudactinotalea sp. HY158]QGH70261.1 hypothetical protein GCE65_12710 [Pseudactinotalea sp. HY158]
MAEPTDTRAPVGEAHGPGALPVLSPRPGDPLLEASAGAVRTRIARMRSAYPEASTGDLRYMLTRRYLFAAAASGGLTGAAAAAPRLRGAGALALTAGHVGSFVGASAAFVLAVAELEGMPVDDVARRRALLLAALLGRESGTFLSEELRVTPPTWGRTLLLDLPVTTVARVNKRLYGRVLRHSITRVGAVTAGRLLPYGVGAVVGYTGSRALGRIVVDGVEEAFA